jgi:transposase
MKRLTPEQIRQVYDQGPEAVVDLVTQLFDVIDRLEAQVQSLQIRVAEWERQVHRNSRNSSQPPSADGLKKPPPQSQRRPSGRRPGGQSGHPGDTLKMVAQPDAVDRHPAALCGHCGETLVDQDADRVIRRQVFDLPPMAITVTEHQAEVKTCPRCHGTTTGIFPPGVDAPVQYGPQIMAFSTYLQTFHMIPVDRIRDLFRELWGRTPSGQTLLKAAQRAAETVAPVLHHIRDRLQQAPVVNVDETGMRVEGQLWWMHTATAPGWTLYGLHHKRGEAGIQALGVMQERDGVAVHDFWKPYYRFPGRHALCNAHLLRDLTAVYEVTGEAWVDHLRSLLADMQKAVTQTRAAGQDHLDPARHRSFMGLYHALVQQGRARHPDPQSTGMKRGRVKRDLAQNLIGRLETRQTEILAFLDDFAIPFDNNAAERALRMTKVKQKVSGTFRTAEGGRTFAAIRSYVVTARQHGYSPLVVLRAALAGEAWFPT